MKHNWNDVDRAGIAIVTLSDTRTQAEDKSGQLIQSFIKEKHELVLFSLIPDDVDKLTFNLLRLIDDASVDVIICNGGTGMSRRDITYATVQALLEKELLGFGEQFRRMSYEEIGVRGLFGNALAGINGTTAIFALPGSTNAVRLAMEELILPMIPHLIGELRK